MGRNTAKGTRWETTVVTFLNSLWKKQFHLRAYRPAKNGRRDVGDIHGLSPFIIEAKDDASHDFAGWLREAEDERVNAEEDYGVVVVKRRRVGAHLAYTLMTLETFAYVVRRLARAEQLLERYAPPEAWHQHTTALEQERADRSSA